MSSRIRVYLVDDHEVVRLGLKGILDTQGDIEVVGESGDAELALREVPTLRPDLVIMDVRMPGTDGITACRTLRQECPDTVVLMLTSFPDEEAVLSSIMAGASGYLLKNTGRVEILRAIRAAASGESLLDPAVTKSVLSRLRSLTDREESREVEILSERERGVLALVATGKTNKEIAAELVLSEHTVRNHVSRIFDKLNMSRRAEAASFAVRHGLADPKLDSSD